jgi:PAS domain S-box-containing protein
MSDTLFLSIVHNAALLLSMVFLMDLIIKRSLFKNSKISQFIQGMFIGLIGIALMLTPWVLVPGIIFDTRSILLGISGLFFGIIPTTTAMVITAIFRIYIGGAATSMGISVIVTSGLLGIIWRQLLKNKFDVIKPLNLYLFGLVIHLVMLFCTLALPFDTAFRVLREISFPVMVVYPIGTMLVGLLFVNRLRKESISNDLKLNNLRLRSLAKMTQHAVDSISDFLEFGLDEAVLLTSSQCGFVFLYSEETQQIISKTISRSAVAQSSVSNLSAEFKLNQARLLGESIRQRKTIIVNTALPTQNYKIDCPPGHFQIKKFMSIPVFSQDKIVALVGMANKEDDYNEVDELHLTLLFDYVWRVVERKQAEEELRQSEERYRTIINNLPNGMIFIFDKNLKCVFCGGEEMMKLGITQDWVLGKELQELIEDYDDSKAGEYFQRIFLGESIQFDTKLLKENFSVYGAPLSDREGKIVQILALFFNITGRMLFETQFMNAQKELEFLLRESDISRRVLLSVIEDKNTAEKKIRQLNTDLEQRVKERTEQLQYANNELEAFAYSVSHDLRTPLRALDGFSSLLLEDYKNVVDETGRDYLERIKKASGKMGQLIEDLLNLSRISRRELTRSSVNMSALARQCADDFAKQSPHRMVRIEITPNLECQGDSNLLKIAMENLINNAFKFTNQQAYALIEFGVIYQDGKKVYFVRDNGIGFDMSYATRLFTPFQRLHNDRDFPGTGIGLVTVQRIINKHGGKIWAESIPLQGAIFFFTLD